MKARRCGGCGAPLPDTEEFERPTCRFCGMVHDPATSAAMPFQIAIENPVTPRAARGVAVIMGIVFLIAVLAPLGFIYMQWRASNAFAPLNTLVSTATSSLKKTRTTRELRDLPRGFHDLETTPPPGGYASVDAVAGLPWALAIAQAWSADARIERIDVERMRPDGSVNAADDAESKVTYRFTSPDRSEELYRRAETSGRAEVDNEFWVQLGGGRAQVIAHYNSASFARAMERVKARAPGHPTVLPLTELVARPGAKRTLRPLPFYRGYLIYNQTEGWVWYFSTLANESFPRMRARDGAPYPYR